MLRKAKGSINEERRLAMHERQNAIVTNATKAMKTARRRKERRQQRPAAVVCTVSCIDFSKDPMPLESELWEPKS